MTLKADAAVYEAVGVKAPKIADSEPLRAILNAGYKATAQTMRNLCKTTAHTATMQFENVLDRAWLKVHSGAFDTDSAVRSAVKELAEQGIHSIRYPSGKTDSIETAVRRAVVTGVNQTSAELQLELADELGCDFVEVSAHAGARPEHAKWQGKIYSRSGKDKKYPPFVASTGYKTGAGLCGWNCRHTFGPYIEGSPPVWTEEKLAELNEPKYEYDGKKLTEYEAQQLQRHNERQIRRWKREYAALEAAGRDTSEASAKIRQWQSVQRDFLDTTGLKRQYSREQIGVAKSIKAGIMKTGSDSVFIQSIDSPIEQRHTGKGNPNAILHFDVSLSNRQKALLEQLPNVDSRVVVRKSDVSMADLSALTASTGSEFALFTKGGERLVIRGSATMVNVDIEQANELAEAGYRWSGHTHPGTDTNCLLASRGDVTILNCFRQNRASIYNSTGAHLDFWKE